MSFGEVVEDEYFHRWVGLLGLQDVVEASRTTRYDT
jgi:hypothetical protein